ncbi:exodeoxyribonuclease VII small subunit [Pseudomonas sp. CDFA 553]|uniref:exodeoxyribonuclease VII small subunit n=1 Tax=Pseudomonas quasicaspiana TaxID=2829821 RepID=UPI001E4C0307|nr:exodeoxyribonuclease VII small subunit [Pseudomonas quasicaspiana]MCD5986504.1 exodeoxyribonuclease VII small subunit [Pseudomonas quasicaspiana]
MQDRTTYEANAAFIRDTVSRLEAGEVTIDELESLTAEMAKAMKFCQERLTRTRQSVADTMKQQTPPSPQSAPESADDRR